MRKYFFLYGMMFISHAGYSQTLGGNAVFNFLKLPNSPQLTALGGINLTNQSNDISLAFNNPALLRDSMHSQTIAVFNSLPAGIKNLHWMLGYHHSKLKTNFAFGIHYFNYGNFLQTDAIGNVLGEFRPTDFVVQLTASRQYLEKWFYGLSVKYINSNYGIYRSSGIAMDVGVNYYDKENLFQVGVVAKNMGTQLTHYASNKKEELPFDLEIGISKRLEKAPFQFSATIHHVHQFDIRYNDTTFNNDNPFGGNVNDSKNTGDKIFRHFVLATQLYLGKYVEVTMAYNHLRRSELKISNAGNGLNGFSLGVGALLPKLTIRYARAYYQSNTAYNQIGINLPLNQYFGLGKFGERIHW
ncbi:MAG TPA: type IX secretion system protein PorQ [Chitinophagaceae bacterium]|nr:type IX secretion system protein PorQ [Chitinophagaceae bacterium]